MTEKERDALLQRFNTMWQDMDNILLYSGVLAEIKHGEVVRLRRNLLEHITHFRFCLKDATRKELTDDTATKRDSARIA